MQGLVNFTTAIANSIAVLLPAFCYLMACACFLPSPGPFGRGPIRMGATITRTGTGHGRRLCR